MNRLPFLRRRLLIKDPTAAFLSQYLCNHYHCRVLILVRHPGAFAMSLKRLGWGWHFKHFLDQTALIEDHLKELVPLMIKKNDSMAYQAGVLWLCIYTVLHDFYQADGNWKIVKHEDLSSNPLKEFRDVFQWLGLTYDQRVVKRIVQLTGSENRVEASNNKVHDLYRDSKKLVHYWKKTLSEEERTVLRNITEPLAGKYYDDASWA
ncbi:MAG: hypothetical protein EHM45_23905 [Desulfobacteraceae bacterium]|nr:MAG: hypothetical protein EHM45_23905 [Desulfobacteraceae bacterium]